MIFHKKSLPSSKVMVWLGLFLLNLLVIDSTEGTARLGKRYIPTYGEDLDYVENNVIEKRRAPPVYKKQQQQQQQQQQQEEDATLPPYYPGNGQQQQEEEGATLPPFPGYGQQQEEEGATLPPLPDDGDNEYDSQKTELTTSESSQNYYTQQQQTNEKDRWDEPQKSAQSESSGKYIYNQNDNEITTTSKPFHKKVGSWFKKKWGQASDFFSKNYEKLG